MFGLGAKQRKNYVCYFLCGFPCLRPQCLITPSELHALFLGGKYLKLVCDMFFSGEGVYGWGIIRVARAGDSSLWAFAPLPLLLLRCCCWAAVTRARSSARRVPVKLTDSLIFSGFFLCQDPFRGSGQEVFILNRGASRVGSGGV